MFTENGQVQKAWENLKSVESAFAPKGCHGGKWSEMHTHS